MFENIRAPKSIQGAVISIDRLSESVKFCIAEADGASISPSSVNFKPRAFDKEFYDKLGKLIKQQKEKNPTMNIEKVNLILPDTLFLLDTVSIPMIHKKAMQHSLSLAIETIYDNAADMNLMTYAVSQTRQAATYGLVGIRKDLLDQVKATFAENGVTVSGVTFASNAAVNGAMAINQKLKNDTFMLIDIKESAARFAIVVRGCTMGYYDLPFGYNMLYKSRVASEDTLFDHRAAELLVLNAKEKARAKQLTMGEAESTEASEAAGEGVADEDAETVTRGGKRLPKFMQRPTPQTREEYIYENFRIFIKWALSLIANNRTILQSAKLDTIYVNMPEEYKDVYKLVNRRSESHKVTFSPLLPDGTDAAIAENLELYGGFFAGRFNEANTF